VWIPLEKEVGKNMDKHLSISDFSPEFFVWIRNRDCELIEVYDVWASISDLQGKSFGLYLDKKAAENAAKGSGWFGGNGIVNPTWVIRKKGSNYGFRFNTETCQWSDQAEHLRMGNENDFIFDLNKYMKPVSAKYTVGK
jgi:hypothetical protein